VDLLARVPWPVLPLPDGRPLCSALELVVVPGLRLGLSHPRAHASGGPPLVVAVDAGELAAVEPETEAVLRAFPHAVRLMGSDATAERVLSLAPNAEWIHFAGHGLYSADSPFASGLRLADRWIVADELSALRLRARWITLSACQTARALVRPGEEWFGLARSLLGAGVPLVVASQWDIEDAAASALMRDVYTRLAEGERLPAALARAQAVREREGVHPLEWAGFVVLGGPAAVGAE
jgi:CHAT domain-containing protein